MMMKRLAIAVLAAGAAMPAVSHHSLSGQFEVEKSVHLTGTISRVDWINPHTYIHLDVKQDDGSTMTWRIESLPVAMMRKAGVSKQDLMAEGTVEVDVHPARNGTPNLGYLLHLKFPDGRYIQFNKVPGAQPPP
jgi:hypothetical protein